MVFPPAVDHSSIGGGVGRVAGVSTDSADDPADGTPSALVAEASRRSLQMADAARAACDAARASGQLVWDPFDPAWSRDPFTVYDRLRRDNPVHRSPLGFWVFTRHADCLAVLRDRRSSSDERNANPESLPDLPTGVGGDDPMGQIFADMAPFLFRDPPDHTRLRGLVQKAFTPRVVESLRPAIDAISEELLDAAAARGALDVVADFAYPLPMRVIVDMLGVPAADHQQFKEWSDALARGLDPDFLLPPEAVEQRLGGILSFVQYFSALIEERRRRLGDDLLSRLISAEEHGDVLNQGELISTCILLLVAGHETTVNLIAGGTLALLQHPDQAARLRDDDTIARVAVEELTRFVSPVQLTGRVALADMEVGGVTVAAGDFSMLLLGSANRDPDAFVDPDLLDLARRDNNHLGFGFGIHHCLGAPLARLEAQIALPKLLRRHPRLAVAEDELVFKQNVVLRGFESLPVTLSG